MYRNLFIFILIGLIACKPASQESTSVESSIHVKPIDTIAKVKAYKTTYSSDYLMGKFTPSKDDEFVMIDPQYADREGLFMRKQAYEAYLNMYEHAKKDGIKLTIRSATRNFDYQRGIWERKWTGNTILSDGINAAKDISNDLERALKILEYSSMPGTSRHHWGTDIDLNAFNNEYFEKREGKAVYKWLLEHANTYGFGQPYTPKGSERPDGYNEEKWHWSFLPLSSIMTRDAQELLRDHMIKGFKGDHTPEQIGVVEKYILGIHKSCKQWH